VGAQHPNYDFRLAGQGELVLASLVKASAVLVLPEAERALVTDLARDQVVVELPSGPVREVALAPGTYAVRLFKGGQSFGGRVTLLDGTRRVVAANELLPVSASMTVARKGGGGELIGGAQPQREPSFRLGVSGGVTGRVLPDPVGPSGPKWQLRISGEPLTTRLAAAGPVRLVGELTLLGVGEMSFDAARAGEETANEAGAQLRIGYRLALEVWRLTLGVGVEAGAGLLAQLYGSRAAAVAFVGGPRAMARLYLAGALSLELGFDVTFTGVQIQDDSGTGLRWFALPAGALGLSLAL
jgi:hypothetical protein